MTATRDQSCATLPLVAGLEVRLLRTEREFDGVLELRRRVFGEEQGLAAGIDDRDDARSTHVVAAVSGRIVGSGRLTPATDRPRQALIAWVATLPGYRGRGVGTAVMRRLLAAADDAGFDLVTLSAQTHALAFYRRLGFTPFGRRFVVAGVEHQMMSRARPVPPPRLTPAR